MAIDKDEPKLTTEQIKEQLAANKAEQEAVIGEMRSQIKEDLATLRNGQTPYTEGRELPRMSGLADEEDKLKNQLSQSQFQDSVDDLLAQNRQEARIKAILLGPHRGMYESERLLAEGAAARKAAREKEEKEAEEKALAEKISDTGMTKFIDNEIGHYKRLEEEFSTFTHTIVGEASKGLAPGAPSYYAAENLREAYKTPADITKDNFKSLVDQREKAYRDGFASGLFNEDQKEKILGQLDKSIAGVNSMINRIDNRMDLLEQHGKKDSPQYKQLATMMGNLEHERDVEKNFRTDLVNGAIQVRSKEEQVPEKAPEKAAPATQYITMNVDESQLKNAINQGQIGDTREQNLDQIGSLSPAQIAVALPQKSIDVQVG